MGFVPVNFSKHNATCISITDSGKALSLAPTSGAILSVEKLQLPNRPSDNNSFRIFDFAKNFEIFRQHFKYQLQDCGMMGAAPIIPQSHHLYSLFSLKATETSIPGLKPSAPSTGSRIVTGKVAVPAPGVPTGEIRSTTASTVLSVP